MSLETQMSSNSRDKLSANFLDEWLIEQKFPINVPFQMKLLAYLGYSQLEINRLKHPTNKKNRGAPKKEITKNMLRADKFLSAKDSLIERGHENPSNKAVIEFLIQAAIILYDNDYISKEDRDLFTAVAPKSIQNKIKEGLNELNQFSKK